MIVAYHPDAATEYAENVAYYNSLRPELGKQFNTAVLAAVADISDNPFHYRIKFPPAIRLAGVEGFPYNVIFRELEGKIPVLCSNCTKIPANHALITDKHCDAPIGLVDRALSAIGILSKSLVLAENLTGIVIKRGDKLTVRHPVYVRYLLERVVDPKLTSTSISGLLQAFSQYDAPIIKHLRKTEATIYKGLINHRFLWDVLKGRESLIIPLYKNLEKYFELDGLFWLQYGLSLRDFHANLESLEKLRTAYSAYQMDHTQHALGQQLIIVAGEASDKRIAMNYFEEARDLLEPLYAIIDSDDTYPIVTLAEGHTNLIKHLDGIDAAQNIAKTYLPNINKKCESMPNNEYLKECYEKLFRFAATGSWVEKNHKI